MWFASRTFDLALFHAPVWLCWLIAFLIPTSLLQTDVPVWVWVVAVLLVDVGHVWSSIYRTYLDPTAQQHHRRLLRILPILCFVPLLILAIQSEYLFWRVLAYVAVYHFIKQQVGVAALYRVRQFTDHRVSQHQFQWTARLDSWTVYAGTVGPMIYWHAHPDKTISWFIPGDLIPLQTFTDPLMALPYADLVLQGLMMLGYIVWYGLPVVWCVFHAIQAKQRGAFPIGKALWVLGTWVNWWLGIVYFDSEIVFTITNTIAHGIPYYALIGRITTRKFQAGGYTNWRLPIPKSTTAVACVGILPILLLALGEEYLWNGLLYRDYDTFFQAAFAYPMAMLEHPVTRAIAVAALSMPQVLHYVLDGFIWKFNAKNPDLRSYMF